MSGGAQRVRATRSFSHLPYLHRPRTHHASSGRPPKMFLSPTDSSAMDSFDEPFIKQEPCTNDVVHEPFYSLPWVFKGAADSLESVLPYVDLSDDVSMDDMADTFTWNSAHSHADTHEDQGLFDDAYMLSSILNTSPWASSSMASMASPVTTSDVRAFHCSPCSEPSPKPSAYPSMMSLMSQDMPATMLMLGASPASDQPQQTSNTCTVHSCKQPARSCGRCEKHGRSRQCNVTGCTKNSQSNGKCIRHGGGRRCEVEGCPRGAQARGKCKAHGGGVHCRVPDCYRSSQGMGLCRTHGGGKLCDYPGCKKGTQRHGKCSTHGGARRCSIQDCDKVDRGGGFCGRHKPKPTKA